MKLAVIETAGTKRPGLLAAYPGGQNYNEPDIHSGRLPIRSGA